MIFGWKALNHNGPMAARWLAFVIWAAVAAMAAAWGLRLFVPARPAPLHTVTADTAVSPRGDLTRLFGVEAPPPPADAPPPPDARFKLVGVAAPRSGAGEGYALIAVDGKPARAFRLGAVVDGMTVLQEVRARGATLGPRNGPATVTLEIPPLPQAATGTMPMAGAAPGGAMPMPGGMPQVPQALPQAIVPPQPPTAVPVPAPNNDPATALPQS